MRFSSRSILTWVLFFAYVSGGLIVPVAHRHNGGNCCGHSHEAQQSPDHVHASCGQACPFGHKSCAESSQSSCTEDSSNNSPPCLPIDSCPACELLCMASDTVGFVTLSKCEFFVPQFSTACSATANLGDLVLPTLRGPPTC